MTVKKLFILAGAFIIANLMMSLDPVWAQVGFRSRLLPARFNETPSIPYNSISANRSKRHHKNRSFLKEKSQYNVFYNRVDGILFNVQYKPSEYHKPGSGLLAKVMLGFGIESKRIQYELSLERGFFGRQFRFAPGFEIYDKTFSEDRWIISRFENSLAAFLLHEDFMDYYRLQGYGGYIKQNIFGALSLKAGYYEDTELSLPRKTDWALFGGRKKFRENPPIQGGTFRGYKGQIVLDTRDSRRAPERGWYIQFLGEYFPADLTSDFYYRRYIFDIRRYQPISDGEILRLRMRLGDSRGDLPIQKWFDFGGISTLRAYRHNSFRGTRMALLNFEYFLNWDEINWKPGFPLLDVFNLILFADAGTAWDRSTKEFVDLTYRDFAADVGIALTNSNGRIRLNFAKRTDRSSNAVRITFRLRQPF